MAGLAEGSGHEPHSRFAYQERMTRCPKRRHLRKEARAMSEKSMAWLGCALLVQEFGASVEDAVEAADHVMAAIEQAS